MGKASAVYLRATADELNEWLVEISEASGAGPEVYEMILMAAGALFRAANQLEVRSSPNAR